MGHYQTIREPRALPPSIAQLIRFEHMRAKELYVAKAYVPPAAYIAALEVVCGALLASSPPRGQPAAPERRHKSCKFCRQFEYQRDQPCGWEHPGVLQWTSYVVDGEYYSCNHRGRCPTCPHCAAGPQRFTRQKELYSCCSRDKDSSGCRRRSHVFEVSGTQDKLRIDSRR